MALRLGWSSGHAPYAIGACRSSRRLSRAAALPALGKEDGAATASAGAAPASLQLAQGQNVPLTPAAAILAAAHAGERKLETVDVGRSTNIRW